MTPGAEPTGGQQRGAVSAVIVNYRSAALTVDCVASLRRAGVEDIVVVDSASGDDCRSRLATADPDAAFVELSENRGYGAAANAGVARAGGWAVVVCNPDLVLDAGSLNPLTAALAADDHVGAVGPRINRPDGTRYPSARSFPSLIDAAGHGFLGLLTTENRWSRRYLRTDAEDAGSVDWISGAMMLVRRAAWDAVGGFDEAYFMFLEDVDLCWRLHRAGWDVRYEPAASVVHLEGASRASVPYRMIIAHHRSLLRYGWRRGSSWERAVLPIVAVGLALRAAFLCGRVALGRRGAGWEPSPPVH